MNAVAAQAASSARPALFGIVQGFIAASIYFSTGLVAERALGLTWAVFLAGGVLFAVIVPCYVEGASLHQERGGATVIARYAFNELVSFIAGWAICLDYLILVALCAFASTDYLGRLLERLQRGLQRVPDRRGDRALRRAGGDPRRRPAALRARGGARARRPRPAVAGGRARAGAAVPARGADRSGVDRAARRRWRTWSSPSRSCSWPSAASTRPPAWPGRWRSAARGLRRLIGVRLIAAMVPYLGIALVASVGAAADRRKLGRGAAAGRRRRVRAGAGCASR